MGALPPGVRFEDDALCVTSRAGMRLAGEHAVAMQASHLMPLLAAAERGELALACIHAKHAALPTRRMEAFTRPIVVLVGDDPWPDAESVGPAGWGCARRLRYWRPQTVIVHGTGQHPEHYHMAADVARVVRRVAMIETASAFVDAWAEFLDCPNTIRIVPPAGCSHPDKSSRVMQ